MANQNLLNKVLNWAVMHMHVYESIQLIYQRKLQYRVGMHCCIVTQYV